MKSPITLLRSLLNDYKRLLQCEKGLDRDYQTIKSRFEHEGIGFLTVALPTLCDALEYGLAHGEFTCPSNFKKVRCGALPRLFSGLLSEVFDISTGLVLSEPSIECIKALRETTRLYKKLQLTSTRKEELHVEAERSFFETDERVRSGLPDPNLHSFVRRIASRILLGMDTEVGMGDLQYRHGPGAVQEGVKGNQKWAALIAQLKSDPFDRIPVINEVLQRTGVYDYNASLLLHRSEYQECPHGRAFGGIAKLATVSKNATAARTITVEPVLNQFIQQGLNKLLRKWIAKDRILSNCLALTDQTRNQKLALEGSFTGKWATIDLTSASDLLSLSLVKTVFSSNPLFLEWAVSCRSHVVVGSKHTATIHKFAGMGNALTFPIQSVCFAVICIAAMLEQDGLKPSTRNIVHASESIQVFGDDIIIKTEYYHTVAKWIAALGLSVNTKKSFYSGNFRESCGVDAYKGVDITPVYIRTNPYSTHLTASDCASLVSACNQLWMRGLYEASDAIRIAVEDHIGPLPLVNPESGLLGVHDRYGSTAAHRWDSRYHTLMVEGKSVRGRKVSDKLDGVPALVKFFLSPGRAVGSIVHLDSRGPDHLTRSARRYQTRLVRARVPAKAG